MSDEINKTDDLQDALLALADCDYRRAALAAELESMSRQWWSAQDDLNNLRQENERLREQLREIQALDRVALAAGLRDDAVAALQREVDWYQNTLCRALEKDGF